MCSIINLIFVYFAAFYHKQVKKKRRLLHTAGTCMLLKWYMTTAKYMWIVAFVKYVSSFFSGLFSHLDLRGVLRLISFSSNINTTTTITRITPNVEPTSSFTLFCCSNTLLRLSFIVYCILAVLFCYMCIMRSC